MMTPTLIVAAVLLTLAGVAVIIATTRLIIRNRRFSVSSKLSYDSSKISRRVSGFDPSQIYYPYEDDSLHIVNPDFDEYKSMDDVYVPPKKNHYSKVFALSRLNGFGSQFKKQPSLATLMRQGSHVAAEDSLDEIRNMSTIDVILRPELLEDPRLSVY